MSFHKLANSSYTKVRKMMLDELDYDGTIKCGGCFNEVKRSFIETHHIIKRSQSIYLYAYIPNLFPLCVGCHRKAHDTVEVQKELKCYDYLVEQDRSLKMELNDFVKKCIKPDESDLLELWGLNK